VQIHCLLPAEKKSITSSYSPLIHVNWQELAIERMVLYKELRSEGRKKKQENQNYFEAHKSNRNKRDMKVK